MCTWTPYCILGKGYLGFLTLTLSSMKDSVRANLNRSSMAPFLCHNPKSGTMWLPSCFSVTTWISFIIKFIFTEHILLDLATILFLRYLGHLLFETPWWLQKQCRNGVSSSWRNVDLQFRVLISWLWIKGELISYSLILISDIHDQEGHLSLPLPYSSDGS